MKKRFLFIALALTLVLSLCVGTAAAVQPRASTTLAGCSVSADSGSGRGEVKISYDIKASDIADRIGVSSIQIYKANGAYVTTVTGSVANVLIVTDTNRHRSSYVYQGSSGTSYYAVVTVFATIGSDSDSKTVTTATVKAP